MEFKNCREDLKKFAHEILNVVLSRGRPVFLCVGSDKFVSDSVGPIVSELLRKKFNINAYVYGGVDYNINATNLMQVVNYVDTVHCGSLVIVIDATLDERVGNIKLELGTFAGMGKCIPIKKIGGLSVLGVVGKNQKNFDLNSTRLKIVMELSEFIATGCAMAIRQYDIMKKSKKYSKTSNIV